MRFDNSVLAAEQNNYMTKFVNIYIVFDLVTSPKIPKKKKKILKIACLVRLI